MTRWQDRHKIVPAVYLIVERDDKYLLMRRANTGYQDGNYSFPAGHLDGNEAPTFTAVREAKEEIDLDIDPKDLRLAHCMVYRSIEGDHERVSLFFIVDKYSGIPKNMELDKCDELSWLPKDSLPDNVVPEVKHALVQILAGNVYSEANY